MGNWKNFKRADFFCKCAACATQVGPATKDEVINALQDARDSFGKPLVVSRGVSCAAHNKAVGGAPDSRHLPQHADAVDVACNDPREAWELIPHLMRVFSVVRVYPHHIHCDLRPGRPMFLASPEPQGGC